MIHGSDKPRYDLVAIVLHWMIAVLVLVVGALGLVFEAIPRASRLFYINLHTTIGLVMFGLILMRLLWRLTHPAPAVDENWSPLVARASSLAHKALYGLMLAAPIVGIIAYVWHGRTFNFGLFKLDFAIPSQKSIYEAAEGLHEALAYGLMGLVALHVLGALWHHFIARDGIFDRILPR
jgi:cytochrome b561